MKLILEKLGLALILAALPFVNGCETDASGAVSNAAPTVAAPVAAPPQVAVAPDSSPTIAPSPTDVRVAAIAAGNSTLPGNIDPASPVASVVKLVQAGVSENVIVSFIANSSTPFNLGSDDIIYLRDLGASDAVTTAMINRDQALGQVAPTQSTYAIAPTPAPTVVEQAPPSTTYFQAAPADDYAYFHDSLSPYGSWVEVEGYGRCWQPTVVVVNRDWQPYSDNGRWLYTDAGWYWQSDYSWGWAPFHYGRWFRDTRRGWCWAPDSVWGPSWVSWRYSTDYCGWAPLPPAARFTSGVGFTFHGRGVDVSFGFGLTSDCYTFVPANRFCDSRPWQYRTPRGRETTIYNNTTVINNIIVGNNNTIINRGIGNDRIEAATHTRLQPIQVRHDRDANPTGGRHERFDQGGKTLIVDQPQLNQPAQHFGRMPTPGSAATRNTPQPGSSTTGGQRGQRDPRNIENNTANNPTPGNNQPPRGVRPSQGQNQTAPVTGANSGGNANSPNQPGNRPQPRNDANNNTVNNPIPGNNPTPRTGRISPLTPAGQNQPQQNTVVNGGGNGNNVPRSRIVPSTPTMPAPPVIVDRQNNPNDQQDRRARPVFSQPPVQVTPSVSPDSNSARNQNPRSVQQDTPRYYSPRVDGQNTPPGSTPAQPTFPRNNNNNNDAGQSRVFTAPAATPRISPPVERSSPAAQSNDRGNSDSRSSGNPRSSQDNSGSGKDPGNQGGRGPR